MEIKQFYDKPLAHASYALVSNGEMAVVDPGRNPQIYYDFAKEKKAITVAVIETHPHADFVSSHLQIHLEKGATIYVSEKVGADYPHKSFDEGDEIKIGKSTLKAINTPGHSPDSITLLAADEEGKKAAFTGDTLFIGDVGRPDLREKAGKMKAKREELAESMYHSIHDKLSKLDDDTMIYPAHGAGSLCGKNMSDETSSDLKTQKEENWAFSTNDKEEFVKTILEDQPFIPKYFSYDVDLNKKGVDSYQKSIDKVEFLNSWNQISADAIIIDTRNEAAYKKAHLSNSINIMLTETSKFETWLGTIVAPEENYFIVSESKDQLKHATQRAAKIGYEALITGLALSSENMPRSMDSLDLDHFKNNLDHYTIVDIRNNGEVAEGKFFKNAIAIPLHELRERVNELPKEKPIVVHCAGGFRSAAGSSIVQNEFNDVDVFDLSEDVKDFQ